jgi:hypothetical protein
LAVGLAREVDDVNQYVRLVGVAQELVAEALSPMGAGNETGDVDELDRDEPDAVVAVSDTRRTGLVEFGGRTLDADVRLATLGSMVVNGYASSGTSFIVAVAGPPSILLPIGAMLRRPH